MSPLSITTINHHKISIITEDDEIKWKNIVDNYLTVDYTLLHEGKDNTELSKEAACVGGTCEIGFVK